MSIEKIRDYFINQDLEIEDLTDEDWGNISDHVDLSEDFIEKHSDKVYWYYISECQKLSEPFIEKYSDKVDWAYISRYQKLSENFIEKHSDKLYWNKKTKEEKIQILSKHYDIEDDYISAYKSTEKDGKSIYAPNEYKYEVGKTYTTKECDCNLYIDNSYGLAAWTKKKL